MPTKIKQAENKLKEITINNKKYLLKSDTGVFYDYDLYMKIGNSQGKKVRLLLQIGRIDQQNYEKPIIYFFNPEDDDIVFGNNNKYKVFVNDNEISILKTKYLPKISKWKARASHNAYKPGRPGYKTAKRSFKKHAKTQRKPSRAISLSIPKRKSRSSSSRKIKTIGGRKSRKNR